MNGARSRFLLSRIPWAWRYLRRYGLRAILRRLFPTLSSYRPTLGIYRVWIGECDRLCRRDIAAIQHHIATMTLSPHVSVLMTAADGQESLVALSVRSLIAQLYPHWSLQIVVGSTIAQRRSPFSEQDSRISIIET